MKTSISTNHPALNELRKAVNQQFGRTLTSLTDFELLSVAIETQTGEHLNTDTLRRLWGIRHDAYQSVRESTLNILTKYVGHESWDTFCEHLRHVNKVESDLSATKRHIRAQDMQAGEEITICWQPNRICCLKFEGDDKWQVLRVEQSHTLCTGDILCFSEIVEHQALCATSLIRNGQTLGAVRLGIDDGVSFLNYYNHKNNNLDAIPVGI